VTALVRPPTHRALRRAGAVLLAAVLSVAALAAICFAGVTHAMNEVITDPPPGTGPVAAAVPLPVGRITVAVAIGGSGTVTTDAFGPVDVFGRSDRFAVYTVAATRAPRPLTGGLHVVADHTFDEALPRPDVVVVPAVVDAEGATEAPLRRWIGEQAAGGSLLLGVCDGAKVLAATGLLDGRRATSFWADLDALGRDHPAVGWVRGERWVEDGDITTTAGVSSGAVGALRMVERLAGRAESDRVGRDLAYPGWSSSGPTGIPVNRWTPADLPQLLNAAFPWMRPAIAVGLVDGVGEIDVAAAMEVYSGQSLAARTVPVGPGPTVVTRHGITLAVDPAGPATPATDRIVVPGLTTPDRLDPRIARWAAERGLEVDLPSRGAGAEFGFDPILRDLARHGDRATAVVAAKYSEYPSDHLTLSGPAWPWRATALFGLAVVASVGLGVLPAVLRRATARRRA
jgi:putative intracellular protease/amidase